ncbi:hypothetical protein [Bradyrhizobium sp.]|uniref:hypothetical protein n=1 Tax=Bradyrhizobium sp. TaxID=376 RepID=UPI0025B8DC78|nr:hypothetical protein [Bradyrhizobium sp.]
MMQLAVELAELLHLDLLGLFLEDSGLIDLASMPFSREFKPLGGGWQMIDPDRMLHDFELAARGTERKFLSAAKRLPSGCQFKVARGSITQTFASVSRSDDIVMIAEPRSPAERVTQQFAGMIEGAFRSAAAVMLVPPHIARTKGPVVAITASSGDPSILAAAAIAFAAKEELIIIENDGHDAEDPRISKLAAETGLVIRRMAAPRVRLADPAACAQAFHQITERLIVMTRGVLAEGMASAISAARRVPVLVIEPLDEPDESMPPPGR